MGAILSRRVGHWRAEAIDSARDKASRIEPPRIAKFTIEYAGFYG